MIKNFIIDALTLILCTLILLGLAFILINIYFEIDEARCMNMPYSEMKNDDSCSMYWRAE